MLSTKNLKFVSILWEKSKIYTFFPLTEVDVISLLHCQLLTAPQNKPVIMHLQASVLSNLVSGKASNFYCL